MAIFLQTLIVTIAALLAGAGVLHLLPRIALKALSEACARPPLLDLLITYFTIAPLVAGPIYAGWAGLGAAVLGQVISVLIWGWVHEALHPAARRGPRIVKTLNGVVGRLRNHGAVWLTALVVPVFWIIRLAQIFIYPPITWLVQFPRYRSADWVSISRHKFSNLVGHDRIWCLYCDWMTGVWSLGTEMLRNVESFWCPIRFASGAKCENCKLDFPDLDHGWVPADGTMPQVAALLHDKYASTTPRAWFGHPTRLTVEGRPPAAPPGPAP